MVMVTCPICEERVSGADSMDLSNSLRDHLVDIHKMDNLSLIELNEPMPTKTGKKTDLDVSMEGGLQTGKQIHISCTFCGKDILGDDEDDLGNNLKEHWGDDHQIRPTIRAEVGISKAMSR